ncbi:hypothetical protein [Acanthopleuribacter pedis]|uniref:Uncharacterized protein n=1 Tax=Acanthopleuribacter pedis TaxID=442870 RepID=A0A8J7QKB6_9BACT|nr:hypothetical protein [Acanthopleuribacter pedis]MBO1319778.1 hypothetical protein [Acanthopleuribacter pedis]
MARLLVPVLLFLFAGLSVAQVSQYAPHLRQDAESWIGFANPGKTEVRVTITGFNDLGEELGATEVTLTKFARYEASATALFGAEVAWAKIDTAIALPAYVRYAQANGKVSLVEMTHLSGETLYVSQIEASDQSCGQEIALVNTSTNNGQILSQPIIQRDRCDKEPIRQENTVLVEGISTGWESTTYDYLDQEEEHKAIFWDSLTATGDMSIAGVQHIGVCSTQGGNFASMVLPRTAHRGMMFPNIGSGGTKEWTKIVLINTFDRGMRVRLRALYDPFIFPFFEATQTEYFFDMEPLEKREFLLNQPDQIGELTSNASWYEVTPFEGGLVGYMLSGNDSGALAASDANDIPSTVQIMPYTPTSDTLTTEIGVVNVKKACAEGYLIGFNDQGRQVARKYNMQLLPGESMRFTLEELFGDKAREVTWTRFAAHNGDVTAYALVRNRTGSDFALMHATSTMDQNGTIFFADFEHFDITEAMKQGWTQFSFGDLQLGEPTNEFGAIVPSPGAPISQALLDRLDVNFDSAFMGWHVWVTSRRSSEFFTETVVPAKKGVFYVGYEPSYASIDQRQFQFAPDREALLSPFFEVPQYGEWYFQFDMRFINPQWSTDASYYGIVWREEGSDQWTWIGASGKLMQNPTALVSDCWLDVVYRYADGVMSGWIPFGAKIPVTNNGKRIQVGVFYLQDNAGSERFGGPLMFVDNIHLTTEERAVKAHYGAHSEGTFQYAAPVEATDEKDETED